MIFILHNIIHADVSVLMPETCESNVTFQPGFHLYLAEAEEDNACTWTCYVILNTNWVLSPPLYVPFSCIHLYNYVLFWCTSICIPFSCGVDHTLDDPLFHAWPALLYAWITLICIIRANAASPSAGAAQSRCGTCFSYLWSFTIVYFTGRWGGLDSI